MNLKTVSNRATIHKNLTDNLWWVLHGASNAPICVDKPQNLYHKIIDWIALKKNLSLGELKKTDLQSNFKAKNILEGGPYNA